MGGSSYDPDVPRVAPVDLDFDHGAATRRRNDSARALARLQVAGLVGEAWLVIGTAETLPGYRGVAEHPSTWDLVEDRSRLFTDRDLAIRIAQRFAGDDLMGKGLTFRVWPVLDERAPVRVDWVEHERALRKRAEPRAAYRRNAKRVVFEALNPALWDASLGPLARRRLLR